MRPAGGERTQAAGGGERASAAGVDAAEARWQRGKRRQGGETGTSLVKGVATRVTVDQGTAVRGGPAREPRQARAMPKVNNLRAVDTQACKKPSVTSLPALLLTGVQYEVR